MTGITQSRKVSKVTRLIGRFATRLGSEWDYAPTQILPCALNVWRGVASELGNVRDVPEVWNTLRELISGGIVLREENGELYAELGACQINMVAGAGFEPATFGL